MEEERVTTGDPTLGRAVSDLVQEVGTLVRQELELAKCELAEKAGQAKGGATRIGVGGVLALMGAFGLTIAMIFGLTLLLKDGMGRPLASFVSALIVGVVLGGAGYLLARSGAARMNPAEWLPRRTVESIKEDARWARRQV